MGRLTALSTITAAGVAAAAIASGAGPAGARVLNAEGVLPPGQSGFVSVPGVAMGTGSPHLYDQQPLFIDFKRKPFGLNQPGTTETVKPGVTITRDAFGVPAVRGDSDVDAWYGAGYAVAQDRLFQLEAFRHATQGRLAELTGKKALEDDLIARRDYYTAAERQAMFDALPQPLRNRIEGYRDGINAWIAHVQTNPQDLPGEYPATGTQLTPWTIQDTISVGIFLARTVPSGDGQELRNLRAVQDSGRPAVLDALVPLRLKNQLSTVPRASGLFTQGKKLTARQEIAARRRSLNFVATLPKPTPEAAAASSRKAQLAPGRIGRVGGSSMFAVREPGGRAVLFNGPQLGFSIPELFVELEVHAPGLDVRGVTAAGVPVIGIGHNEDVAWGLTSGLSDDDDLYAEKLVPGHPEQYYFKGAVRQMDCRDEVFTFKSPPTGLLGASAPESGTKTERICRTVHGPVQSREGDVAYARRYAIWNREIETLQGLSEVNAAHSVAEVEAGVRKVTWNENLMAADSQGNIGYWHPGLIQQRPRAWDQRLPLPGTGEAEWPGLIDRAKLPRVINPKQGWLANWNNIPSQGWTSGDGESSERITGQFHRVGWLMRLVRALKAAPSFEGARATVQQEGSTAQQRPLASARLRSAARGATGPAAAVLGTINAWDGNYVKTDAAGTIDPGVATWETFKEQAARLAVDPLGAGAARFEIKPGNSHIYDNTDKEAYALRTLRADGYRRAAAATFTELAKRFGTEDPARWRDKRALYEIAAQGGGQPPPLPFFDRGTWEQIVEVGP